MKTKITLDLPSISSPGSIFSADDLEYFRLCGSAAQFSSNLIILSYYTNLRDSVKYSKKEKKRALTAKDGRERTALTYRRLSASHILTSFVLHYRHELPQQLPLLWEQLSQLPFPVDNDQLPPSFIDQMYLIVNIGKND